MAAGALSSSEIVAGESPRRIRAHLLTHADWNPTKSLTELSKQLAVEYEDRFLVELIQNGYDAHPKRARDGVIHILLDERSEVPLLYVANTGRPFNEQNFQALTNVARSNKPAGEGIGNKGVGFRSVLQICDWPEIYSRDPDMRDDSGFNGFCFRFARDDDVAALTTSAIEFAIVREDFSPYLLPVPASPTDPTLARLRGLGAATVVRLPLEVAGATELARGQLARLTQPHAPVALFLERLRCIVVEHIDADGVTERHEITRQVEHVTRVDDVEITRVRTADATFLLGTRSVERAAVLAIIDDAIAARELDSSWRDWSGDAEVGIAVSLDDADEQQPSLYTHLPMRTASPLAAHLNAPFHTKISRTELNESTSLNAFFLRTAADVCATIVKEFASAPHVDDLERQSVVADLICWDAEHLALFESALQDHGLNVKTSSLIPLQAAGDNEWGSLEESYTWPHRALTFLTTDRLSQISAPLVSERLGSTRITRLQELHRIVMQCDMTPDDELVAEWAEAAARALARTRLKLATWNDFYLDLAAVFAGRKATALRERRILLDQKGSLRRAGPWDDQESGAREPTVFVPPQRLGETAPDDTDDVAADEEEVAVPVGLQRAISYLHDGLALRRREGSTTRRTPILELLEGAQLVERFDRHAILTHLRRLLRGRVGTKTKQQALRWVFLQDRSARAGLRGLDNVGLHVPTRGGWILATDAVFSGAWRRRTGSTLTALVEAVGEVSGTMTAYASKILLDPDEWPFRVNMDEFGDFLERIGVRDGLHPIALRSNSRIQMDGRDYRPEDIARRFGLDEEISEMWAAHVREEWAGYVALAGPYTSYRGDQELWVLPGQDAYGDFSQRARDLLAGLVIESIEAWPSEAQTYTFERFMSQHRSRTDPQSWPSPAVTFVAKADWFPMSNPRRRESRYFVPPNAAWHFDESDAEPPPRFARLCPRDHRRRIGESAMRLARLVDAGLRVWNSPDTALDRLVELASLLSNGDVAEGDLASYRRALEAAWSDVAQSHLIDASDLEGTTAVASVRHILETFDPRDNGEFPVIYVPDSEGGLAARIIDAAGLPLLVCAPRDGGRVAGLIADAKILTVRRTSAVDASVVADAGRVACGPTVGVPLLDDLGHWFARVFAVIVELQGNLMVHVTERVLQNAVARLRRVRLLRSRRLDLLIDGVPVSSSGQLTDCVHIADDHHPVIVLRTSADATPSWDWIEAMAESLSELTVRQGLASDLRAAALVLDRVLGGAWREPTDAELARALHVSEERVRVIGDGVRSDVDHVVYLILPAVVVLLDLSSAETLAASSHDDREGLLSALAEILDQPLAQRLLEAGEAAESPDDVRRRMNLGFGEMNDALEALGRPPLHFPGEHAEALRRYMSEHREDILSAVRSRFVEAFRTTADLSAYAAARRFDGLTPDAEWLHSFDIPPDDRLATRVREWISTLGGSPREESLQVLDDVRANNQTLLDTELPRIRQVASAWCRKHSVSVPAEWTDVSLVLDRLNASGCLDFEPLDLASLLKWLVALDCWPSDMPLSTDLESLGLTSDDLATASDTADADEEMRRRARRVVVLDNEGFEPTGADLRRLVSAAQSSASEEFLSSRTTIAKLDALQITPRTAGGDSLRGGGGRASGRKELSPDQRIAVGLVGEALAFEWLRHAYPEATPDSWVSANRVLGVGGHEGNDFLGYDFEVIRRSQTLLFEVKATPGDAYEFDFGESELHAAKQARRGAYRIIFLRCVLDSTERELLVLPNPLETGAGDLFAQVNEGVRLRFRPS
jgi:hypothetical protein